VSSQEPEPSRFPSDREDSPASTGATDEEEVETATMANRFDIRRLIGGVFVLYGLILIALGIFASHAVKTKAAGININLWTGLGMLVFGALMIFWGLFRPVVDPSKIRGEGSGPSRRASAT
jgi:hypothetical protein